METAAGGVAGTAADAALHAQQQLPRAADAVKTAAKTAAAKSSGSPTKGDTIHTLCTSNGSPYLNFQNRIMCETRESVGPLAVCVGQNIGHNPVPQQQM